MYMTRPKSTIPNRSNKRTGATIANSTIDCERWPRGPVISVTTHGHVRVGHDVDRAAKQPVQKSRSKAEAHQQNDVHVGRVVASRRWRVQIIDTRQVAVADEQQRLARCAGVLAI